MIRDDDFNWIVFPSPYGEVGFDPQVVEPTIPCVTQFPSPYGEVGFDLSMKNKDKDGELQMFPSPYGEVGFDQVR